MYKKMIRWTSVLSLGVLLAACQPNDTENSTEQVSEEVETQEDASTETDVAIAVEGMADHYHTGDEIELEAVINGETDHDHWHWYSRESEEGEWEVVPAQTTSRFAREATSDGLQIKAVLFDDQHNEVAESDTVEVVIDDHHGGNEYEAQRIYNGFFYNDEVADRDLSEFEGDWKSVYPYLLNGDLDEVMEDKAENSDTMTTEDYIEYYEIGYETDVERIVIEDGSFAFYYEDGEEYTAAYDYDGYEVLTYERGNRGVRFIFERSDGDEEMPQYIQFSDHNINPTNTHHFHLYWGDDREALLDEVTNWPTYYPTDYSTEDLIRDMLAH